METNLRLSEAIRLGSLLRPQAFGHLEAADGRTCAMGAAMMAAGVGFKPGAIYSGILRMWPWAKGFYSCPAGHNSRTMDRTLPAMIEHLNDIHRWTRERIADWVQSIEPSGPDQDLIAENREVETCCV